jgi:hypothetical protein
MRPDLGRHMGPCVYASLVTLFLSIWCLRVTGRLSVTVLAVFTLLGVLSLVYGRLLTRLTVPSLHDGGNLTVQFLSGYLLLNTLLALLSLGFPFGIATSALILAFGALVLGFFLPEPPVKSDGFRSQLPSLLCLLVSATGASLWCADSMRPMAIEEQQAIFRTWQDTFIHVRHISAISQSHGLGTLSDIQMSNAPPRIYHYASYFTPAAVSSLTAISAFDVYASFLLPFGILLSGLAAFSLAASLWGPWAGLAAAAALILLPDAYQQGFANRYLSYGFLQQVNPGGFYGVACVALGWVLIFDGCKTGRYRPILLGYAVTLLTVVYKAHVFVANAFLIMMYPCLFLARLRPSRRFAIGAILVILFASVVALSQRFEAIPTLRLDGRSARRYMLNLLDSFDPGAFKSFFAWALVEQPASKPVLALYAVAMLLLSTFGIWTIAWGATFFVLRAQGNTAAPILFFPLFVVANYALMSLGLAMDVRRVGTPDEFLNRPLVWAYFAVVVWTAGGAYAARFGTALPRRLPVRIAAVLLVLLGLAVPWTFSRNLQTFPAWPGFGSFEEFASFPLCRVQASLYIREHSRDQDILQDSENDFHYLTTGLAERQAFVIANMLRTREEADLSERLADMESFKRMTSAAELTAFAARRKISWYLLHPTSTVSWPTPVLESAVYACDGYRVYHFAQAG